MSEARTLTAFYLGRRAYAPVLELMNALVEQRLHRVTDGGAPDGSLGGSLGDVLLLLEHEPVITGGRGAKLENVRASAEFLKAQGVEYHETARGGDVTLHAPGQLVAYPIIDLKPDRADVRKYVQLLTRVMMELCRPFGIESGLFPGKIGLWADAENPQQFSGPELASKPVKLGAVGVRISRWVTSHGFALNFTTDLRLFDLIVPCGIAEYGVGSVEMLSGAQPSIASLAPRAAELLARELEASVRFIDLSRTSLVELGRTMTEAARERGQPLVPNQLGRDAV